MIEKAIQGRSIDEVIDLLKKYNKEAKLIAGGTDLIVQLRQEKVNPKILIDISNLEELRFIRKNKGWIEIGGGTSFREIGENSLLKESIKGLSKAAQMIGSPQIRNRATIGGNICNGSPAADIIPPLLVLEGTVFLRSPQGKREIPLENILKGKGKVDIKSNEILQMVRFKELPKNSGIGFSKLGLRNALAISRICTAVKIVWDQDQKCIDIKIANGALGIHAMREYLVEEIFLGRSLNNQVITEAVSRLKKVVASRLEGRPSVSFKMEAVEGTFREALKEALERWEMEGQYGRNVILGQ